MNGYSLLTSAAPEQANAANREDAAADRPVRCHELFEVEGRVSYET